MSLHQRVSYKWLALSVTSLGALVASMNSGTLIIALPTLLRDLHTSLLDLIWILLAYNLTQTVLVLNVGRFSDMWGRKRLFVLGFAVFTAAALLAGMTSSVGWLIALRALQGVGGAFMIANSSAIVTDAFPRSELGLAIGTNQMMVAVGLILGPILGGWLTTLGWRWVFWFNVPLGLIGLIWALWTLREPQAALDRRDPVDFVGNLTYAVGLAALMLGLSVGGIENWNKFPIYAVIAVLALIAFFLTELRIKKPMLDLTLFGRTTFSLNNLLAFISAVTRQALTFLFVFYFQGARGYSPVLAGLALGPLAVGLLVASPISGRLADRFGPKLFSWLGLALSTLATAGFALTLGLHTPYWQLAAWMLLGGLGSGLFNSPNSSAIMGSVPPDRRGIAAGTRTLLIIVGGVLSIIYTISVVVASVPKSVMFQVFSGLASNLPAATLDPFVSGLRVAFWTLAAIGLVGVLLALAGPVQERRPANLAMRSADD